MLWKLFMFKQILFWRAKVLTIWWLVCLRHWKKKRKSLNFVRILILCVVIQHKYRRYFEFLMVIVAEGGTIFNLFLRKNCLFRVRCVAPSLMAPSPVYQIFVGNKKELWSTYPIVILDIYVFTYHRKNLSLFFI